MVSNTSLEFLSYVECRAPRGSDLEAGGVASGPHGSGTSVGTPSGWTQLNTTTSGSVRSAAYHKAAVAGQSAPSFEPDAGSRFNTSSAVVGGTWPGAAAARTADQARDRHKPRVSYDAGDQSQQGATRTPSPTAGRDPMRRPPLRSRRRPVPPSRPRRGWVQE